MTHGQRADNRDRCPAMPVIDDYARDHGGAAHAFTDTLPWLAAAAADRAQLAGPSSAIVFSSATRTRSVSASVQPGGGATAAHPSSTYVP